MRNRILYLLISLFLLTVWQYFANNNSTVRLLISSPSLVVNYFSENHTELLEATKTTLIEAAAGLIIAVFFSFATMVLCFYFPRFLNFIMPVMVISQVIPLIVLAPFFIILMGLGIGSKIAMAALMCFFPIFVNFAQGYKAINQRDHELMYIYNASTRTRISQLYFPLSMPSIMAGLKISATLAVIGAIVAEFAGAEVGLGRNLYISALRLEPEMMMTSLILSTCLGLLFFSIVKFIGQKFEY